jgi:hypothetical protein
MTEKETARYKGSDTKEHGLKGCATRVKAFGFGSVRPEVERRSGE